MHAINRAYNLQIETMQRNGREWLAKHPDAQVRIVWNYPPEMFLVCDFATALDMKFVMANKDGLDLIKALWPPAVDFSLYNTYMIRFVIERLVPEDETLH